MRTPARTGRFSRVGSVGAGVAAACVESVLAHTASRGLVVLVGLLAVGVLAGAIASAEERLLMISLVFFALGAALSFFGRVHTATVVGAAVSGVLVLAAAELARWASAIPRAADTRGRPAGSGVAVALLIGCLGAAAGAVLIEERSALAGLGLAAVGFGVLCAVGILALALAPGSAGRSEPS